MSESDFEQSLYQQRRDTIAKIVALGQAAYPNGYAFTHTIPEVRAANDPLTGEQLEAAHTQVSVAGRIMAIRVQGKAGFTQLQQGGQRLQIYVRKDDVGDTLFALYKLLDLGDHIGVRGHLMRTRTGELTLHAHEVDGQPALTFLAKAMLALPDKYHGLEDTELRYRQRYVDLFMNIGHAAKSSPAPVILSEATPPVILSEAKDPEAASPATAASGLSITEAPATEAPLNVREVFEKRAKILRAIRKFFDDRGYLEVETPMLHTVAGGAAARPFKTHHNALDIPLSLRIAPELYLKRLVVGGLDRVYEINRNFRNEGVSTRHNPEFTMLEFYQAYANYEDLMDLTQELITFVAMEVNGTTVCNFNGNEIDLSKWKRYTMREAIVKWWPPNCDIPPTTESLNSLEGMKTWLEPVAPYMGSLSRGVSEVSRDNQEVTSLTREVTSDVDVPERSLSEAEITSYLEYEKVANGRQPLGKAVANIFEFVAEPHLIQPTIIYDFPLAVSPLSKQKPDDPDWVERFEFYIGGFEVGNAFSELNDPDEQRARFQAQVADKDPESMAEVDEDYVRALGYGLPPTGGEGIGIDRLTMILTGAKSIRDVILFPLMRPQSGS